jgi:hypothetical protein
MNIYVCVYTYVCMCEVVETVISFLKKLLRIIPGPGIEILVVSTCFVAKTASTSVTSTSVTTTVTLTTPTSTVIGIFLIGGEWVTASSSPEAATFLERPAASSSEATASKRFVFVLTKSNLSVKLRMSTYYL